MKRMKKIAAFLAGMVISITLTLSGVLTAHAEPESFFRNGDFSEGNAGWNIGTKSRLMTDGSDEHPNYVLLEDSAGWVHQEGIRQSFSLEPGEYTLEVFARGNIYVILEDGNPGNPYYKWGGNNFYTWFRTTNWKISKRNFTIAGKWEKIEGSVMSKPNGAYPAECKLMVGGTGEVRQIVIKKKVPWQPAEPEGELLTNGDFQLGVSSGFPTHWEQSPVMKDNEPVPCDELFTVSENILTVDAANGKGSNLYQEIPIEPNTRYKLSYFYKGNPNICVTAPGHHNLENCFDFSQSTVMTIEEGWTRKNIEFNSSADAKHGAVYDTICIRIKDKNSDDSVYYVADISFAALRPEPNPRATVHVPAEIATRWTPPAEEDYPPYSKNPPKQPKSAKSPFMSFDGTFESYGELAEPSMIKDEFGKPVISHAPGQVTIVKDGVEGGHCVRLNFAQGMIVEEKNIPLKPNTWYRIGMHIKGNPWQVHFRFPGESPYTKEGFFNRNYMTEFFIDHAWGGGYEGYSACKKCGNIWGMPGGDWTTLMFIEDWSALSAECPSCGAKKADGDIYPESNRRRYWDWTYIYMDFRTGDYVGKMQNGADYWTLELICTAVPTFFDNIELMEITEEFGEAVE